MGYSVRLKQKIGNSEYTMYVGVDFGGCYIPIYDKENAIVMTKTSAEKFAENATDLLPHYHIVSGEAFKNNKYEKNN